MNSGLRRHYLDALGISLWLPRRPLAIQPRPAPAMPGSPFPTQNEAAVNTETEQASVELPADDWTPPMGDDWELVADTGTEDTPAAPPTADSRGARIAGLGWAELEEEVRQCAACGLCASRTQTVFGVGDRQADWMVVGEAPGEQEDLKGEPFVGPSGQLLDNMLKAIGLSRRAGVGLVGGAETAEDGALAPAEPATPALRGVYIANVVKCRPPGNRNPHPDEVLKCDPYLARQVALVRPKIILAMGRFAVQSLLRSTEPIGKLRGRVHHYQGVPVIVTYHPAYLLRSPGEKRKAWDDLRLARSQLDGCGAH